MFKSLFMRKLRPEPESDLPAEPEQVPLQEDSLVQVEGQMVYGMIRQASLEKRERQAVENILERESLLSDLDDNAAKELLDWAIECAQTAARSTTGLNEIEVEEFFSERLRATRLMMRSVNKLVGRREEIDAKESENLLLKITEQAAKIYGRDILPEYIPQSALWNN